MNILESILLTVSNLLFYPVILAVLLIVVQQGVSIGKLLKEIKDRSQKKHQYVMVFKKQLNVFVPSDIKQSKQMEFELLIILRRWEQGYAKSLNFNQWVIKLGPALGLMGTLIPMGTALSSLSQGDLMVMSMNMVTAFTTTVVGMACGLSAFSIVHKRAIWKKEDLLECEILCERIMLANKENTVLGKEPAVLVKN